MPLHESIDKYRVRSAISALNTLNKLGVLSDSAIAATDTINGLKNTIANAINNQAIHIEHVTLARAGLEAIQEMANYNLLTDANVAPLTTYAGLLAILAVEAPPGDDTTRAAGDWTYSGNAITPSIV